MKLIPFAEQTVVIGEGQPEYHPLPAHQFPPDGPNMVSPNESRLAFCWQLTWRERFKILCTGIIWHQVLTFKQPLQPQLLTVQKPEMIIPKK